MKLEDIRQLWIRLWFAKISPAPICLFRICLGFLLFISTALMAPDITTFFGGNPIISSATIHQWEPASFSLFYLLPESDTTSRALYLTLLISSFSLMVGFFTRLSTIATFVLLVSFHNRLPCIFNGADMVMRQQAFLLIFAPAGAMYSVDAWFKQRSDQIDSTNLQCERWPLLLLQLQLAAVYCQTFCAKIVCDQWLDGTALYYATHLHEYTRLSIPFLFDQMWFCKLGTYATLFVEFALWTLIWIKEFRYPVLLAGIALHVGIDLTMFIGLFSYTMMISYILFVDPKHVLSFVKTLTGAFSRLTARAARGRKAWV